MADVTKIREEIEALDAEIRSLHETEDGELREFTPEEQEKFDSLGAQRAAKVALLERHNAVLKAAEIPEQVIAPKRQAPNVSVTRDAFEILNDTSARTREVTDAVVRELEGKIEDTRNQEHVQKLFRRHSSPASRDWARQMLVRSTPAYESAWLKMVQGREFDLTVEERTALGVTTNANGAYFLPTAIDPTVILTGDLSDNVYRQLARKVEITNGAANWEGITSAGVTASWDGEIVEVSDDTPTVGNPTIPTYRAQAFAQASFSAVEDIPSLASDLMIMFAQARDNLEGAAFATGSGSTQPTGVWTAVDAVTASRVTGTTAATIGLVDIDALHDAVPRRYIKRSTWTMHPYYASKVRELGTALSASFSTYLPQANTPQIRELPVVESYDAPDVQTTTALDQEILLGDFNQFVVVDRPGSAAVEFIPMLFNTTSNLPDGRKGWYMTWRTGSDVTNVDAFRLLVDKT